jgi:hypothetical protein
MEYRKGLIGAASILALSVGMSQGASASVSLPSNETKVPVGRDVTSASLTDPLLDLIVRTQGSFTEEAIQSALTSMYADPSHADVARIPELLNNITALGVARDVLEVSKQTLMDIVASAKADEALKMDVLAQLESGAGSIELAQTQEEILRRRGRRDPGEVGQVGPGGGGY